MTNLFMHGSWFLIGLVLLIVATKKRNYFAVVLILPYLIYFSTKILENRRHFQIPEQKLVNLREMRRLDNASLSEVITLVFNSQVHFGDGTCAGGIINDLDTREEVCSIFSKYNISFDKNASAIWLKDSTATKAVVGKNTLFIADQSKDEEGIWVTTIPKNLVKHISSMDGANK